MPSYIETVKQCFANLNIQKLKLVLKDEYSYEDTTKEIFLEELEGIFSANKNSGDTSLIIYNGACGSSECTNKGKRGYRFIGNVSRHYFDLIFQEEGDNITDIYSCGSFSCNSECGALENRASIYIQLDEQLSFNRTLDYELKLQSAEKALFDLFGRGIAEIDLEGIRYWLHKNKATYEKIGSYSPFDPQMKWTPFLKLYEDFRNLVNYIDSNAGVILQAYDEKPDSNEENIIAWIIKYEQLHENIPYELPISDYIKNIYRGEIKNFKIVFTDEVINKLYAFNQLFEDYYNSLMNKYDSYTFDETNNLYEKDSDWAHNNLRNLRFHLNRRNELMDEGIIIPLFLRNETSD